MLRRVVVCYCMLALTGTSSVEAVQAYIKTSRVILGLESVM